MSISIPHTKPRYFQPQHRNQANFDPYAKIKSIFLPHHKKSNSNQDIQTQSFSSPAHETQVYSDPCTVNFDLTPKTRQLRCPHNTKPFSALTQKIHKFRPPTQKSGQSRCPRRSMKVIVGPHTKFTLIPIPTQKEVELYIH